MLEQVTGKKITSIAFPDGNYTDEVKKTCMNAGYTDLYAVSYQLASDNNDKNILYASEKTPQNLCFPCNY